MNDEKISEEREWNPPNQVSLLSFLFLEVHVTTTNIVVINIHYFTKFVKNIRNF